MTTIYDIAKRAGVSPATVSRVLNGYPDVSEDTRAKVQRITSELGYQPNAVARGLATKRSMSIGVLFWDHANEGLRHPFFQDVLATFRSVVGEAGYDLVMFANAAMQSNYDSTARRRHVDGILVVGIPRTDPGLVSLSVGSIPCMSVDLDLIGPRAGYLTSDNVGGSIQAVDYLVSLGHREIAFIGDRYRTKPGHDRLIGYEQALMKNGLAFRSDWILHGDFTEIGGYEATIAMLETEHHPTAIFCAGDMMAIGAMRAIRQFGLEVGKDISVVGFDDVLLSRFVTPALTTVRQQRDQMGERTAKALLELIENTHALPPVITVPTELVVRDSVQERPGAGKSVVSI